MSLNLRFAVPRDAHAAAFARSRAGEALAGVPDTARADVELALSELVTNAVRHGEGAIEVKIRRDRDHVFLEVVDGGDEPEEVQPRRPDASGGWGLRLLDAISRRWGVYEGTTHVWCEIPLDGR